MNFEVYSALSTHEIVRDVGRHRRHQYHQYKHSNQRAKEWQNRSHHLRKGGSGYTCENIQHHAERWRNVTQGEVKGHDDAKVDGVDTDLLDQRHDQGRKNGDGDHCGQKTAHHQKEGVDNDQHSQWMGGNRDYIVG